MVLCDQLMFLKMIPVDCRVIHYLKSIDVHALSAQPIYCHSVGPSSFFYYLRGFQLTICFLSPAQSTTRTTNKSYS